MDGGGCRWILWHTGDFIESCCSGMLLLGLEAPVKNMYHLMCQACPKVLKNACGHVQVASVAPTNPEDQARLDAQVTEERARYDQVKLETQAWASFLVACCFAAAWGFYTRVLLSLIPPDCSSPSCRLCQWLQGDGNLSPVLGASLADKMQ